MQSFKNRVIFCIASVVVMALLSGSAYRTAKAASTQPATRPATRPQIPPEVLAAVKDSQTALAELQRLTRQPGVYTDPVQRAKTLEDAKPIFERLDKDAAEVNSVGKLAMFDPSIVIAVMADPVRAALGDAAFVEKLQKQTQSESLADASAAKGILARAQFLLAGSDAAAQDKALDALQAAVKADPQNDNLCRYLAHSHDDAATTTSSAQRIESIVRNDSTSRVAGIALQAWDAAHKLASLEGKPLTITVPKVDGTPFSSDDLKGKVVMVDLWATWCGPCVAELPHVTKVYQKYHDQGLEIISISCDKDAATIMAFMAKHPEVTWTQLFDPKTPGWAAAAPYGVNAIPTMFLIDKKGIVRTVQGREKMEEMIPQLLAE